MSFGTTGGTKPVHLAGRRLFARPAATAVGMLMVVLAVMPAAPARAAGPAVITRYAGIADVFGGPTAGPALNSKFRSTAQIAVDRFGNLYIADEGSHQVVKVDTAGALSIIAGTGVPGLAVPGLATDQPLNQPVGVAVDSGGNVYIADASNRVFKVTPAGQLSIFAGNGMTGPPTAGLAINSRLNHVIALAVDGADNLYLADDGNRRIEKVTPAGMLTIIAGDGRRGAPVAGLARNSPAETDGLAADGAGNVYAVSRRFNMIYRITGVTLSIVAGTGIEGPATEGPATASALNAPRGVAIDGAGNIYIADTTNRRVEKITPDGMLSFVVGNGIHASPVYGGAATSSPLRRFESLAVDALGIIYLSHTVNATIDRIGPAAVVVPPAPVPAGTLADTGPVVPTFLGAAMLLVLLGRGLVVGATAGGRALRSGAPGERLGDLSGQP